MKQKELVFTGFSKKYIPLMQSFARGIFSMQKPDGSFIHVLNSEDYTVRDEFRTPYYDGEAVFGLLHLYDMTKDPELLEHACYKKKYAAKDYAFYSSFVYRFMLL